MNYDQSMVISDLRILKHSGIFHGYSHGTWIGVALKCSSTSLQSGRDGSELFAFRDIGEDFQPSTRPTDSIEV